MAEFENAMQSAAAEVSTGIGGLQSGSTMSDFNVGATQDQAISPNPGVFEAVTPYLAEGIEYLGKGTVENIDLAKQIPDANKENVIQGFIIGLNQESKMAKVAKEKGIDIKDPSVQIGTKIAQAAKAGAEMVLLDAMFAEVGIPAQIVMKNPAARKAVLGALKAARKSGINPAKFRQSMKGFSDNLGELRKSNTLAAVPLDVLEGATKAGAANVITNTGAALGASALGAGDLQGNIKDTLDEAKFTATVGGVINPLTRGFQRSAGQRVGAEQVGVDAGSLMNQSAQTVTDKAAAGVDDAYNIIQKVNSARNAELKPIKKGLDAIEKQLMKSKNKIPYEKLPKNIRGFFDAVDSGKFPGINKNTNWQTIKKEIIKVDEAGNKFINEANLVDLKNNFEAIRKAAGAGDKSVDKVAQAIKSVKIDDAIDTMMPGSYQSLKKQYKTVQDKWGNSLDNDFKNMSSVYDKLDLYDKEITAGANIKDLIDEEDAIKFVAGGGSKSSSQIGKFVDEGVITPNQVENTFYTKAGLNKKDFMKPKVSGKQSDSIKMLEEGMSPEKVAELQGEKFTNRSLSDILFKKQSSPKVSYPKGERFLDPTKVANNIIKSEKNLNLATGSLDTGASQRISDLKFTADNMSKATKKATSDAELVARLREGIEGLSPASVPGVGPALTGIAVSKAAQAISPELIRQTLMNKNTTLKPAKNQFWGTGY